MRLIPLSLGKFAAVDDADYASLTDGPKWFAQRKGNNFYAMRRRCVEGRRYTEYMHLLLCPGIGRIDHRDGDGLNNQRFNLRPATHQQNMCNTRKRAGTSSAFKGVSWHACTSKWAAKLTANKQHHYLGIWSSEEAAARAYDSAAREHFGEFARLNFP